MNITIPKPGLLKAVSRMNAVAGKKSNLPVLSTVRLEAKDKELTVQATDLSVSLSEWTPCFVHEPGECLISARKLFDIARAGSAVSISIQTIEQQRVRILDGSARFELACIDPDEFPNSSDGKGSFWETATGISVSSSLLADMIEKTMYAVTTEESGYKLSGILFEQWEDSLRAVATDGHRLCMVTRPVADVELLRIPKHGVLLPKGAAVEMLRLCSGGEKAQIGFTDIDVSMQVENAQIIARLLVAKFPDYHAIVPQTPGVQITMVREEFLDAVRRMMIMATERYRAMVMEFNSGAMVITSVNPEIGNAEQRLECSADLPEYRAGFNPKYFLDAVSCMTSQNVTLRILDQDKAVMVEGEDDPGYVALIMPMRV